MTLAEALKGVTRVRTHCGYHPVARYTDFDAIPYFYLGHWLTYPGDQPVLVDGDRIYERGSKRFICEIDQR